MSGDELIYQSILENMSDGVMTVRADGRIMTFNSAAENILCLNRKDVLHCTFGEIFLTKEGNDEFNQTVLNAIYESEKVHNNVVMYNTGSNVLTLSVATSFLNTHETGENVNMAAIVVFKDITEVERLRETELKLSQELKKRHQELQNSYLKLEEMNESLETALKKMHTARILGTIFVILVFLAIGIFLWEGTVHHSGEHTRLDDLNQSSASEVYTASTGELTESITLAGVLKPAKMVNVTSPFNGSVIERHFEYGETVNKGDLLLTMDASELRMKHREARIAYIKTKNRVKDLENWDKSDEVAKAKRSVSKAKLSLDSQKKTLEETEILYQKGIVPATEYTSAKQQYTNAVMDNESALSELKSIIAKGGEDNFSIAEFEFENADQKLKEIETQLNQINVYSPVSGTILLSESGTEGKKSKKIEKGVSFTQGELLLSIGDTGGFSVTTSVGETEVVMIKEGQKVKVTGEAFPGTLEGKVSHISSQAKAAEGGRKSASFTLTVSIKTIAPELRDKIRLGMSAVMDILIINKPDALLIPVTAVQIDGEDRYVTLRDKKTGTPRKVKVETGITTLDSVEILKGLNTGDEILK